MFSCSSSMCITGFLKIWKAWFQMSFMAICSIMYFCETHSTIPLKSGLTITLVIMSLGLPNIISCSRMVYS